MPRLSVPVTEALRLAQQHYGLSDDLASVLTGFVPQTIMDNRLKRRWQIGEFMSRDDPRQLPTKIVRDDSGEWAIEAANGSLTKISPEPTVNAETEYSEKQLLQKTETLWRGIQSGVLDLLSSGNLSTLERRNFERLEFAMRQYEKMTKWRDTTAPERRLVLGDGDAGMLSESEIAPILEKMSRRIDELAEQRFKELVARGFQTT